MIQTHLDTSVGPVLADAGQLQQVLMNLCVNAAHAIGGRQGKITLELTPSRDCPVGGDKCVRGPYVCLAVADNGCGMDAATLEHIFDPFFTTREIGSGSGLGEFVMDGLNGFLCDDDAAMSAAIARLVREPVLLHRLAGFNRMSPPTHTWAHALESVDVAYGEARSRF